jgi:hypothetical protein
VSNKISNNHGWLRDREILVLVLEVFEKQSKSVKCCRMWKARLT